MIVSLEEAKDWLRIDGDYDNSIIEMLIGSAESYLKNATGKNFDSSNNLAKLFCLVLVADWYENRDLIGQRASDKVRYTIQSMLAQLKYAPDSDSGGETDEVQSGETVPG